jgi:hypothetical protein
VNSEAKCSCQKCNEHIVFPLDMAGQTINCPHCNARTVLADPSAPMPIGFAPRFEELPESWQTAAKKKSITSEIFFWFLGCAIMGGIFGMLFSENGFLSGFAFVTIIFFSVIIYFAPSIVAHQSSKRNFQAIFILNLFLGWTLIGWVAALVWAYTKEK